MLFSKQMLFWVGCKVRAVEQVVQKILLFDLPIGNHHNELDPLHNKQFQMFEKKKMFPWFQLFYPPG